MRKILAGVLYLSNLSNMCVLIIATTRWPYSTQTIGLMVSCVVCLIWALAVLHGLKELDNG